jgi:quercetin dioxygenase-like cupin family protein
MTKPIGEATPPPISKPLKAGTATAERAPRPPKVYELGSASLDGTGMAGQQSTYVRGQNFCIGITWMNAGASLSEVNVPDEHVIILPEVAEIEITAAGNDAMSIVGPALVIVPAGTSRVAAVAAGVLMRVFSTRVPGVYARARNNAIYDEPDPAVVPLPDRPAVPGPGTVRVYRANDIPQDPTRFGRIFRTDSLIVNWLTPSQGARDTETLSPHVHDDFEQATVTLQGDHIHHLRSPWTPRLREWRNDQHIQCASPSVAIIPPGIVHTSRSVGDGAHELIDVFAPPRTDFAERGWVLNAMDYADRLDGAHPAVSGS